MTPTAVAEATKGTEKTALITGSEAIAVACKLADVDVITGYPIRPYDTVIQYIAQLISNGEMDCEYIVAEGEHSPVRDREARLHRGRPRVLRQQRRGLDVRIRVPHGDARAARTHGGHGR